METLFFLLPICAAVALIVFAIIRVNSGSYLHRRVKASHPSKPAAAAARKAPTACERMEQRYVDWFTSDKTTRMRDRAMRGQESEAQVGQAIMATGLAYRPEFPARVAIR